MTDIQKKYLLIPFEKKDELKKLHKIRWDDVKKLWYCNELNDDLKQYQIKKIVIPYESKDIVKAKYKNIVDIIDEMAICNIAGYAVVDISPVELDMLKNAPK